MSVLSRVLSIFPAFALVLDVVAFGYFCLHPGVIGAIALLLTVYGFPVVVYRLHGWRYPIQEGISYLRGADYSPWWGSHQIQVVFIALPALEAALRLIPGAFSCWLRLWGASIGKDVYWTPGLEIADRGLLEVGDRTVFGHQVELYAHAIKPKKDNLMLYVKLIKIGSDVFVGAGSRLAPGVVIADGTYVPAKTDVHPQQTLARTASSIPMGDIPIDIPTEGIPGHAAGDATEVGQEPVGGEIMAGESPEQTSVSVGMAEEEPCEP
jgi:acetyltransferase-like isoleucine patch superfamily enzyme